MGAGASTLTEDKVKDIVNEEVDLSGYAKMADLNVYAKSASLPSLYVDESDKATLSESNTNDTKWVTPQYVTTKIGSGNINTSTVSTFLASSPQFSKTFRDTVVNDNAFQGNLATSLARDGDFIGGIYAKFNTAGTENVFRNNLKDSIIAGLKVDTTFIESARGPKGEDGSLNDESLKASLWNGTGTGQGNKVMWCADGELCKVPVSKKGVEFTSGEQVIKGFGTGSDKLVKVDDHIALNKGGKIDFIRDIPSGNTNIGDKAENSGTIKAFIPSGNTDNDMENSKLEIYGISRKKNNDGMTAKKIKMYDDVEIAGNVYVNGKLTATSDDGVQFQRGTTTVAKLGRSDGWNELIGNTHIWSENVRKGILKIGDWEIVADGPILTLRQGDRLHSRMSLVDNMDNDKDRIRIYSTDDRRKYFYFNKNGQYEFYDPEK